MGVSFHDHDKKCKNNIDFLHTKCIIKVCFREPQDMERESDITSESEWDVGSDSPRENDIENKRKTRVEKEYEMTLSTQSTQQEEPRQRHRPQKEPK